MSKRTFFTQPIICSILLLVYYLVTIVCMMRFDEYTKVVVIVIGLFAVLSLLMSRGKFYFPKQNKLLITWEAIWIYILLISIISILFIELQSSDAVIYIIVRFILFPIPIIMLFKRADKPFLLDLIKCLGLALLIIGVLEFITKDSVFLHFTTNERFQYYMYTVGRSSFRIRTIFLHPIMYATYLCFLWIINIYRPFKNTVLRIFSFLLVIFNIIATGSRSGWISLLLVTIFYYLPSIRAKAAKKFKRRKLVRIILSAAILIAIFAFTWRQFGIGDLLNNAFLKLASGMSSNDMSNYIRITIIKNAFVYFGNDILILLFGGGQGYSTIWLRANAISNTGGLWDSAIDNQYITIIFNGGIISFIILIVLIIMCIRIALVKHNELAGLGGFCLIAAFIDSFFFDSFGNYIILYFMYLWLLLAGENALILKEKRIKIWR